ncbi:MAG: ankyrin repeat domain-containing protein [Arcobacteraceae bacterium]|nr:ankyrin repeat domain-containing protein [Arcobacteraceae bacterium]
MLSNLFGKSYTVETFKKLLATKPPDLKEIKEALSRGVDVNSLDEKDETFLHYAIKKNLPTCAKVLIEAGIDVNRKDSNNNYPIYTAIDKGNRLITQALLSSKKVNVNKLKDNRTLLQDAVLNGNKNIVNMLLKTDIDINHIDARGRNVAFDAILNGNERIIDTVLEIEDLNLNSVDFQSRTILHQKNVIEDDKLAKKLIIGGADPTILDGDEKSYLLHAALRGIETDEIIDIIIDNGFDINTPVRNKNSILMELMFAFTKLSAAESHRRDNLMSMANKLVKKGIDVNAINDKGETVLFDAIKKLDIEACAFLIKEGTPLNVVNNEGDTVLSEIIYRGIRALDIIYLLIKHGADVTYKNKYQQSIIEILNELILYIHGNIDIIYVPEGKINKNGQYVRLLKEMLDLSKYDVNTISSEGEPLFFKSLLFGNRALFSLYCQYDVNINAVNIRGNSIFSRYVGKMASWETLPKDFREVVIMLLDKKVNVNRQDKDGKTMLSKLIDSDNMRAFRILFGVTKFNFLLQDNRGFTLIHDCISTSNLTIIKLVDQLEPKLKNIPDNIGILPITYAALFGKVDVVLELMNLESNFKSNKVIPKAAKLKLAPLVANLEKLVDEDRDKQYKLDILKDQVMRDFK